MGNNNKYLLYVLDPNYDHAPKLGYAITDVRYPKMEILLATCGYYRNLICSIIKQLGEQQCLKADMH